MAEMDTKTTHKAPDWQLIKYQQSPQVLLNFIAMEGIDGSGTSTQARLLEMGIESLQRSVCRSSEPTTGLIGKEVRQILGGLHPERRPELAKLFAADRYEHIYGLGGILEKSRSGVICISERYLFSSLVYQSHDFSIDELWQLNSQLPLPSIFFYFDLSPQIAMQRIEKRGMAKEIFEKREFLERSRDHYHSLIKHYRQLKLPMQIHVVDASQDPEQIHREVAALCYRRLGF